MISGRRRLSKGRSIGAIAEAITDVGLAGSGGSSDVARRASRRREFCVASLLPRPPEQLRDDLDDCAPAGGPSGGSHPETIPARTLCR